MADRSVSVLMTLSDPERRDARVTFFFRRIYLITLEPFDLAAEQMCGGAHFYGVRHTPTARGYLSAVRFWGFPSISAYIL